MRRSVYDTSHEDFRRGVHRFLSDEVLPEYPEWEKAGRPPRHFWTRAGELGILGIGVPEEYGGLPNSSMKHSAVVTEEAQKFGFALGGLRVHTDIALPYFLEYANTAQKQRWLPGLVAGNHVVALGMSEPEAGSDVKAMRTRAVRDGDHYLINGSKTFISNGAAADLIILAVKTDPAAGRKGISLIVAEAETEGFVRGRNLDKLGLKAQDLAELSFVDMRVPIENLLGVENDGFGMLTNNLAQERFSIALNSQASATSCLDRTVAAVRGNPIGQRDKFELAACAAKLQAGQTLIDASLEALVAGELSPADAAMAKLFCTELQSEVTRRCLDVAGLDHFTADDVIGRLYLDGRVSRIYGGSSEIMKVIVAQGLDLSRV
ncbi:acyl-CoA dehydrogenase [Mycobacterium hodleri]|uniref:Acyl-CoA dehydrogenase n=2 Tax=Mycolicibacterium hodleri TaxID=49897 RepID=A0A502E7Y7_9MYCO|nr:acyl-CoA dehydrogenase [Mycolicibacterium hodleri]